MKKSEKLFEAFTDLDDDLIENAIPKEQEYDIVKPALKMHSWKPWVAGAAVAAAAFGVVFAGMKLFGSGNPNSAPAWGLGESVMPGGYPSGTFESGAFDGPSYGAMMVDWILYDCAEELVNAGDIICTGKVTDISFALFDKSTGRELSDSSNKRNAELNTVYEIEVKTPYRDVYESKIKFRAMGGLKDYRTDEQLELVKGTSDEAILILSEPPEIELGEEYLFILNQYDENIMPSIINAPQTAFPLNDSSYKERFSGAATQDIIDCLESGLVGHNSFSYASQLENENPHLSAEEIVNNEEVICTGKVTNISFEVLDLDTCQPPTENSVDMKIDLYTIYDIELIDQYKGTVGQKFRLIDRGGIRGYKVSEQLEALHNDKYIKDKNTIIVWDDPPGINVGEEYLFVMRHADDDRPYFFCHHNQTAFPLSDPSYRDRFSDSSVNDIIDYLTFGGNFPFCELKLSHNNQTVSLDKANSFIVQQEVQDVMANDCLPENALKMFISDELIEEYGNTEYVIDIVFDDIDAPLAGGGEDKKARTTCHAIALIGKLDKPSYLTYSYTYIGLDGSSENKSGGTYLLSDKSRKVLKMWAAMGDFGAEQSQNDGVHHEEDHNAVPITPANSGNHHDENENHH